MDRVGFKDNRFYVPAAPVKIDVTDQVRSSVVGKATSRNGLNQVSARISAITFPFLGF